MIEWRKVDPALLEPVFRKDIEDLLGPSRWTWYVLYGHRSLEEQNRLYNIYIKGGPRAAPPGKSAHNFGLAVDIVPDNDPDTPGLQPNWVTTSAAWLWLFAKCKAHPRLKSGVSFNDADHVERYKWQDHREWQP